MNYKALFDYSIREPEAFWREQAKAIQWNKEPETILSEDGTGYPLWYEDGKLNVCQLCIDKHIEDGYGEQTAIVYDSPVTGNVQSISFNRLYDEVSKLAGGLRKLGLSKGDAVLIYMPMIPQAVSAMLACARIGAIHSVVFGGFAPHELAIRIDNCSPKAVITASNGIEINKVIEYKPIIDAAIEEAVNKPDHVILYDRQQGVDIPSRSYDIDYAELVAESEPAEPVILESNHPLYILYTSGTTGKPKGVLRDSGGYATALKFSMNYIYGIEPGETFWAASDIGWVVGHSYIVYGPLLNRNTSVLFEGKPVRTPDASTFWRIISEHKVNVMFTAPTAFRAIKREDPEGKLIRKYDLSSLKYLFLAGERCDATTLKWAQQQLNIPVIDHWWQTESGWPMIANMVGTELMEIKPGSSCLPVCGYDIRIIDEQGVEVPPNVSGYIVIKLPLPPGNLLTLWNNPGRFQSSYFDRFEGYYFSGDAGYKDKDGYIFITGRVDDIINVAGHRLSTGEMEEVIASHHAVAECAVFGVEDDLKGEVPVSVVVLKSGAEISPEILQREIVALVRSTIGPIAALKKVFVVRRLPKTRSGKILRNVMRSIANQKEYKVPSTIDDPRIVGEIHEVFDRVET